MDKFVAFVQTKPSLSLVLFSAILTGFSIVPTFASLIMHAINLMLLFAFWHEAKGSNLTPPGVLLLVSIGLTAVMVHPSEWTAVLEVMNFFVLVAAWAFASNENPGTPTTPSAKI